LGNGEFWWVVSLVGASALAPFHPVSSRFGKEDWLNKKTECLYYTCLLTAGAKLNTVHGWLGGFKLINSQLTAGCNIASKW